VFDVCLERRDSGAIGQTKRHRRHGDALLLRTRQCALGRLLCRMKKSARASTVWMLRILDIGSPEGFSRTPEL